jgi:hypothetical protein
MLNWRRRAGVSACGAELNGNRGISRHQLLLAITLAIASVRAESPAAAQTTANPVEILFVGNSFTHGRYSPALNYNAGAGSATDSNFVHDLLCPSLAASGMCTSGAEAVAAVTPTAANTPGSNLLDKLEYLQSNPSAQYTERGPFGGVAGVFLQFTKEVRLQAPPRAGPCSLRPVLALRGTAAPQTPGIAGTALLTE